MERISYSPTYINDFHQRGSIRLLVAANVDTDCEGNIVFVISAGQKKRIENHFCGIKDCRCSAGAVQQLNADGTKWGIRCKWTIKA